MREQTLEGKVAVVSGSSKGIGAATAIELSLRGALVVVNHPFPSTAKDAQSVLDRIKELKAPKAAECLAIEADISTISGPKHLIDETVSRTGKSIDILINNAGFANMVPLEHITLEQWDMQINLNVRGMMLLTQACLPHLARDSRIVNVSSVGARQGLAGATVYGGTKAMVEAFTRVWAKELGPSHGCTVNAIEPGPTQTDGFDPPDDFLRRIQSTIDATPMGARMGRPEEDAQAIAFFCEERSRWITGNCLGVNGGFLMN